MAAYILLQLSIHRNKNNTFLITVFSLFVLLLPGVCFTGIVTLNKLDICISLDTCADLNTIYQFTQHKKACNHHANLRLEMYSFTL